MNPQHRKPNEEELYRYHERVAIMLESAGLPLDTPKTQVPQEIKDVAFQESIQYTKDALHEHPVKTGFAIPTRTLPEYGETK